MKSSHDTFRCRIRRLLFSDEIKILKFESSFTSFKFGWYFLSVASIFAGYLSIYSSNPDPHHDGFIYTQAVAAKNGLIPNRDFFAMYGPGGPYIQGLWLKVTNDSLLSLRMFTVLQLILIFLIFSKLLERYFNPAISCAVSLICLMSGPFRLPWPSILLTLIVLVAIYLLATSMQQSGIIFVSANIGAAAILTLGIFLRLHAILFLLAIVFSLSIGDSSFDRKRVRLKIWLATSFITMWLVSSYLFAVGAIDEYLEQSFGWSSSNFIKAPELNLSFIGFISWYAITPILLLGTFTTLNILTNFLKPTNKFKRETPIFLGVLISCLYLLFHFSDRQNQVKSEDQTLLDWQIFEKYLYTHLRNGLGSISIFAVIFTLTLIGLTLKRIRFQVKKFPSLADLDVVYISVAAASLPQMYPSIDLNHLWYITPLLVLGSAPLIKKIIHENAWVSTPIISVLSFLMVLNSWSFVEEATTSYEYTFQSQILEGMKSNEKNAKEIDKILLNLERKSTQTKIDFDCQDGLFAAYNGSYEADSEYFVRWGELGNSDLKNSHSIFNCWASESTIEKYKLLGFNQQFLVPLFNFKPGLLYTDEELDASLKRFAVLMERDESRKSTKSN